jgi:hypothetical protein
LYKLSQSPTILIGKHRVADSLREISPEPIAASQSSTGLLAANTHREGGFHYDAIKLEEITEEAELLGLEIFDRFKRWRKEERNIQRSAHQFRAFRGETLKLVKLYAASSRPLLKRTKR